MSAVGLIHGKVMTLFQECVQKKLACLASNTSMNLVCLRSTAAQFPALAYVGQGPPSTRKSSTVVVVEYILHLRYELSCRICIYIRNIEAWNQTRATIEVCYFLSAVP